MQITDTTKFNAIVAAAKTKAANDPKWLRSIDKAAAAILSGEMIVTTLVHGALVTTPGGSYACNGLCPCPARTKHCKHRAGARLMAIYEETGSQPVSPAKNATAASGDAATAYLSREPGRRHQVRLVRARSQPATWPAN